MDNLDYGIIGNCKSAALVSKKGSIEWCCLPEFDSSSVFAKILDKNIGGEFALEVEENYNISQRYMKNTNILITTFSDGENAFELIDFMPRYKTENGGYYYPPEIYRYIRHLHGTPAFKTKYNPRLNYAADEVLHVVKNSYLKSYTTSENYESLYLYTNFDKEKVKSGEKISVLDDSFFVVSYNQKLKEITPEYIYLELQRTKVYWLNWMERTLRLKHYNEALTRSALVLKCLTYHKSGAILAAVTTSIPETIGDVRNWDYRFCWIRDAGMTVRSLTNIGHYNAARRFMQFIIDVIPKKDEKIQIMYGINGERTLTENILEHLDGYEGSKPVRIGNAAYHQKQNDIFGILMDIIYQSFILYKETLDKAENLWTIARSVVKTVENNWRLPDKGIWEIRSNDKHFVFSKVLCWVAIDRGIKIAEHIKKPEYCDAWATLRDEIKEDIMLHGWNDKIQAFPQAYDNEDMDAANLLMEYYGFIHPKDPKFVSTVKKIKEELCVDGLMYRYRNHDDFGMPHSSFTVCSFWLVRSLYKIGEKKEAKALFEQLLSYRNHLGILSEDIDFKTKRLLGNFPQGYSHLSLIDNAILLSEEFDEDEFQYYQPQ